MFSNGRDMTKATAIPRKTAELKIKQSEMRN